MRQVGDTQVEAGRAPTQIGWYRFAAREITRGRTVLDAGCGLGVGLKELQATSLHAVGQDLDSRLKRDDIFIGPVEAVPSKFYDVVVSIDVIEHVEHDQEFLRHLIRIAREAVFLTTPLSFLWREVWPYHIREYRAREFLELAKPFGRLSYFKGTPSGSEIYPVNAMAYFRALDGMMNSPALQFPFRAAQKLLPRRLRYNSHQAVLIQLPRHV